MNKKEKALVQKINTHFNSPKTNTNFTPDENIILERWRQFKIINEDAFKDITSHDSNHKEYLQNQNYPFTSFGDKEITKNWYMHFRESKVITYLRDGFNVIAFFVSLYQAILKLFTR